jgi:hypothetical protein
MIDSSNMILKSLNPKLPTPWIPKENLSIKKRINEEMRQEISSSLTENSK